ncbi:centrosomal protein of 112 kDa isoform X2 [Drosophila erecta]|nr:centrosomal protein of 112 kDa isoform X2 [Drosophila erecta]
MSHPVRGNKASLLRANGKANDKQAPNNTTWTRTTTCGGIFSTPPILKDDDSLTRRCMASRIPVGRRTSPEKSVAQSRNTSPMRANPSKKVLPCVSACSLPNRRVEPEHKVTEIERKSVADEVISKRNVVPAQLHKSTAGVPKQFANTDKKSHRRVLELNKLRVFEAQKEKLEHLQSEFMHKIRFLGPELQNQGVFKFVSLTVNDECKVVVHNDDLLRLPKNIPTESISDLKNRCRAIVDQGFMLIYEHIPSIQRTKNDFEAREKREEIRCKLAELLNRKMNSIVEEIDELCGPGNKSDSPNKSLYREMAELRSQKQLMESRYFDAKKEYNDQINQLRAEYDAKLEDQLASRDQAMAELRKSLRRSEDVISDQTMRLADKNSKLVTEDSTIEALRSELSTLNTTNQRLIHRLEDADLGMERARNSIEKNLGQISDLEGELKEARELIVHLQKRPDVMDKGVMEKDLIIADLKLQLQNLEQHKNVLNKQVCNALKQHGDFEDLSASYEKALKQICDLKEALNVTNAKLEIQSNDLSRMHQQMEIDQKLLEARSELITKLQKNEQDNRSKLDQM